MLIRGAVLSLAFWIGPEPGLALSGPVGVFRLAGPDQLTCLKDTDGIKAYLPDGRYALMLVDSRRIPSKIVLPTDIKARLKLVFYPRYVNSLPDLAGTAKTLTVLGRRYGLPQGALFAECLDAARRRLAGGGALLPGLYLLEDGRVRYRFIFFGAEGKELRDDTELILRSVRRFLSGSEPEVHPLPLLDLGARIEGICVEGPCLLYPFTGREGSPDVKSAVEKTVQYGMHRLPIGWVNRRIAELLTPVIRKESFRGIGIVRGGANRKPGIGARFSGLGVYSAEIPARTSPISRVAADLGGRHRRRLGQRGDTVFATVVRRMARTEGSGSGSVAANP